MMKTLYIFPHPDDESFGPAPVIHRQIQNGEEVHLLTLTKGESTKMRFKHGFSKEEMAEVRVKEMEAVKQVLGLTSLTILDLPDGGMSELNPLELEKLLLKYIEEIQPNIIVTYAIHGISGHHDHLACHAAVKYLFAKLQNEGKHAYLKRLAFFTLQGPEDAEKQGGNSNVRTSKRENIDCEITLTEKEVEILKKSLYCYKTFIEVIEETQVIQHIGNKVYFEFFDEKCEPRATEITQGIYS